MPAVGFVARNIVFKLGTKAYECAVLSVDLNQSTPVATATTMCPDGQITDVGTTSWTLAGRAHVDMKSDSLYAFLIEHAGEQAAFEFQPTGAAAVKVTGTVTVTPPSASFTPNAFAVFPFSLPLDGKPTFAWAAVTS